MSDALGYAAWRVLEDVADLEAQARQDRTQARAYADWMREAARRLDALADQLARKDAA